MEQWMEQWMELNTTSTERLSGHEIDKQSPLPNVWVLTLGMFVVWLSHPGHGIMASSDERLAAVVDQNETLFRIILETVVQDIPILR